MKVAVIILVLIIAFLGVKFLILPANKISTTESPVQEFNTTTDKDTAIEKAKLLFGQKKNEGVDLSDGPCLSEEIIPDWSFDIVHNPREAVDNDPKNQCQYFRSGKTHHFVEMDIDGNVVRAL